MWDCIKCGNPRDFASDPNRDPYDVCPDCRVNYGWIDQDREERFKELHFKMTNMVDYYHNDDDNGF